MPDTIFINYTDSSAELDDIPVTLECVEVAFSQTPGGSTTGTAAVTKADVGSSESYTLTLSNRSEVSVSLTGLTMDFDCRVVGDSTDPGSGGPSGASGGGGTCTNRGGARDDSWSGTLDAGSHTVTVYPYDTGSGSYTLTMTATYTPTTTTPEPPAPPPLSVRSIPDFRLPSGGTFDTVFPAATGGTAPYVYSVSGLPPGITFVPSTRGASGTLPAVTTVTTDTTYTTYTITYTAKTAQARPPPSRSLRRSLHQYGRRRRS